MCANWYQPGNSNLARRHELHALPCIFIVGYYSNLWINSPEFSFHWLMLQRQSIVIVIMRQNFLVSLIIPISYQRLHTPDIRYHLSATFLLWIYTCQLLILSKTADMISTCGEFDVYKQVCPYPDWFYRHLVKI